MENWKEEFARTQYNKLAFIGAGAEKWIEQHNEAISTLLLEQRQRMAKRIEGEKKHVTPLDRVALPEDTVNERIGFNLGLQAALNIVLGEGEKQ